MEAPETIICESEEAIRLITITVKERRLIVFSDMQ